jgi:hypothetical protein
VSSPRRNAWQAGIAVLSFAVGGGATAAGVDWPPFVDGLIAQQQAGPKKNPPGRIWHYRYQGQAVFYVPPSCCDVPGELYSADGTRLCSPDGGMTGGGDGKCPDFFDARSDEVLVWADPR